METECLDCPARADTVLVDFAVFLCTNCKDRVQSTGTVVQFHSIGEELDRDTASIFAQGGNERFKAFWSNRQTLSGRFQGKRAEYYSRMLRAEAAHRPFLELDPAEANSPATFSDGITRTITHSLSWLEGKLGPLLSRLDQKLSNTEVVQQTARVVESGYQVYEAQVREHIIDRSGFLHPLKEGADMLDRALDRPEGEKEVEMLRLREEERPQEESKEQPTELTSS